MWKKTSDVAHLVCAAALMSSVFQKQHPLRKGAPSRECEPFPLPAFGAVLAERAKPNRA